MSLSKIYRGTEDHTIQPILFSDFDRGDFGVADTPKSFESLGEKPKAKESPAGSTAAPPAAPVNVAALEAAAFERGRLEGLQEGRREAEAMFGETAQALAGAAVEISQLRDGIARSSLEDMLRLVMSVAEQVIRVRVDQDREIILGTLTRALQAAIKADEYHVRVNPQDLDIVNEKKPLFLASLSGLKNIIFEGDAQVSRGGCLVDSSLGQVDATLETQLAELRQHLTQNLDRE